MGPLPDDDFRPSRRNIHPDLIGRPVFEPYYDGEFMWNQDQVIYKYAFIIYKYAIYFVY